LTRVTKSQSVTCDVPFSPVDDIFIRRLALELDSESEVRVAML